MTLIYVEIIDSEISGRKLEVTEGSTYENVLDILGINQETVLLLKEKQPVPVDGIVVPGNLTIRCIASQG